MARKSRKQKESNNFHISFGREFNSFGSFALLVFCLASFYQINILAFLALVYSYANSKGQRGTLGDLLWHVFYALMAFLYVVMNIYDLIAWIKTL